MNFCIKVRRTMVFLEIYW